MRQSNPTQLRIGRVGTFFGKGYRIVGRAVLRVSDFGSYYYWNEFYLEADGDKPAILVFEETETGPSWKLFKMFDPDTPMTAALAATVKVGDIVEIGERKERVTRVDRSEVYHTEGKTPEGIAQGRFADYFNADAGDQHIVVSWTGDEVEFYSGETTSTIMVATAFRLEGFAAKRFVSSNGRSWMTSRIWKIALIVVGVIVVLVSCVALASKPRTAPPAPVIAAPPSTLKSGQPCIVNNTAYNITSHRLVEMAEPNRRWQRDEYDLQAASDEIYMLAHEKGSNGPEWIFYRQAEPQEDLTPMKAAALAVGGAFKIENQSASVGELFRRTIKSADGSPSEKAGDITYGFMAGTDSNASIFVCWNQTNIGYWEVSRNASVK